MCINTKSSYPTLTQFSDELLTKSPNETAQNIFYFGSLMTPPYYGLAEKLKGRGIGKFEANQRYTASQTNSNDLRRYSLGINYHMKYAILMKYQDLKRSKGGVSRSPGP